MPPLASSFEVFQPLSLALFVALFVVLFVLAGVAGIAVHRWWILSSARKLGIAGHRDRHFLWPVYGERAIGAKAAGLDDRALLAAFHLPDHRPVAKEVLRAELERRGVPQAQIAGFMADPAEITVPSSVKEPVDAYRYYRMVRARRRLRPWMRGLAIVCLPMIPYSCVPDTKDQVSEAKAQQVQSSPAPSPATGPAGAPAAGRPAPVMAPAEGAAPAAGGRPAPAVPGVPDADAGPRPWWFWPYVIASGLVTVWTVVAVVGLLVALVLIPTASYAGRKRAVRILLLRPFGAPRMTKPLKKVVLEHIGPLGHVLTLEDRHYKPNPVLAFLARINSTIHYVLGPILRPVVRIETIKNEYGFLNLSSRLAKLWRPSLDTLITGGQAFNVRSTDPWWQRTIDMMMHSCEVIVMDVSIVSRGSAWEIDQLEARQLLEKCVFIAHEAHAATGAEALAKLLPVALRPQIFLYDDAGKLAEEARFTAELDSLVVQAIGRWGAGPATGPAATVALATPGTATTTAAGARL